MYKFKKKIGSVVTSKFVGTGPPSYKNKIYRAAVSQRLRNTGLGRYLLVTCLEEVMKAAITWGASAGNRSRNMKPADDSQSCYFCGNPLGREKGRCSLYISLFNDAVSSALCSLLDVPMVKDNGLERL